MNLVAGRLEPRPPGDRGALLAGTGILRPGEGVILELRDGEGNAGTGEASPLRGWSPDTPGEAAAGLAALVARLPAEVPEPPPPRERVGPPERARELAPAVESLLSGLDLSPAARFAAETALLDLLARRAGVPLHRYLGGAAHPAPLPIHALLAGHDPAAVREEIARGLVAGIRAFKLKIGAPGRLADEVAAAAAAAELLDGNGELSLDANGALPPGEAAAILERFAGLPVRFAEEPVGGEALLELARAGAPLPLAADESLADPAFLGAVLAEPGIAVLVLKPALLGGLLPLLDAAHRARAAGKDILVTHALEGPVAIRAAVAAAFAAGDLLPCGLAPHPFLLPAERAAAPPVVDGHLLPPGPP